MPIKSNISFLPTLTVVNRAGRAVSPERVTDGPGRVSFVGPFIARSRRPDVINRIVRAPAVSIDALLDPERLGEVDDGNEWCITDGSEGSEGSEGKESKEGKDGSDGKESSDPDNLGIRARILAPVDRHGPMM